MQIIKLLFTKFQASTASLPGKEMRTAGLVGALLLAASVPTHGANIRLMPLGDSITEGYQSTAENGYRGSLYSQLIAQGNQTDFVGLYRNGNVFDPDHTGYIGGRIDTIQGLADNALATYQPNVVTLHIGSNDLNGNYQVSTAPNRLAALIDQIFADDPGVTLLVAQLIPNRVAEVQARINDYNNQIPGIVQARANAGKHIYLVSMNTLSTASDFADNLHPNDSGYQKMANVWYAGIQQVIAKGWITSLPFAGVYELKCVSSGLTVDVNGASTANSAAVIQYTSTGGRNQRWNFIPTSNGYYQIRNANSGLDLNVSGVRTDNGAPIVQYAFGNQNNDQWLPSRQGDGSYAFYNRNSGLVLDMPGYSTQTLTQFDQYGANGGANQHFNCIPR